MAQSSGSSQLIVKRNAELDQRLDAVISRDAA